MLKIRGYAPLLSGDAICRTFNGAGVYSEKTSIQSSSNRPFNNLVELPIPMAKSIPTWVPD
jgi:hypothetical protein